MRKINRPNDVVSMFITDNETWTTCPICNKSWKNRVPIPGLLHKTRVCDRCLLSSRVSKGLILNERE